MTGEPKGVTEKWVQQHKATYAYAFDPGNKLFGQLGDGGLPHAVLIDPLGTVVWSGHPASLSNATISEHLSAAFARPLFEWPAAASKVDKAFREGSFAKALKEAGALADEALGSELSGSLQAMVTRRVELLSARAEKGDLLPVVESEKNLLKAMDGLPELDRVREILKQANEHPDAKAILAGQRAVREVKTGRLRSKADLRKAIEKLEDLEKKHAGTYPAQEAAALRRTLIARLGE